MADDVRWMTYAELAEVLGIGSDSARNLVRRKRWARQRGNDNLARVGVPIDHLAEHPPTEPPIDGPIPPPIDAPADAPTDGGIIPILSRHIERLETEIESLKGERDAERARAVQVDVLTAVLAVEKRRGDELRDERDQLLGRLTNPPPVPAKRSWWPFKRTG